MSIDSKDVGPERSSDDNYGAEIVPADGPPVFALDLWKECNRRAVKLHEVYPPSDDSFLMVETIVEDYLGNASGRERVCDGERWRNARVSKTAPSSSSTSLPFNDRLEEGNITVVEMGSGSGFISAAFLSRMCEANQKPMKIEFFLTDKNPIAVQCSRETFEAEVAQRGDDVATALTWHVRESNFCDQVTEIVEGSVDVLIFNPPYVVTPKNEMEGTGISISWAGGADGTEVIYASFPTVKRVLKNSGACYMCGVMENQPKEICERALVEFGLVGKLLRNEETCGDEQMWVIRFSHA